MDLNILDDLPELNFEINETADPKQLSLLERISAKLDNILTTTKGIRLDLPSSFKVFGSVSVNKVDQLPPVRVNNLSDLNNPLVSIAHGISDLQKAIIGAIKTQKISVPKDLSVTNEVKIQQFTDLLDGIEELKNGFNLLINKEAATVGFPSTTIPVEIQNWMIPQPVTSININPLRGFVKSTAATVTSTTSALPATSLANRRSVSIYNNGAVTIFVGGSDVTTANGVPVGAGTWGPEIDAGPRMILYGVCSGSCDIRVLEMSNDDVGGTF